ARICLIRSHFHEEVGVVFSRAAAGRVQDLRLRLADAGHRGREAAAAVDAAVDDAVDAAEEQGAPLRMPLRVEAGGVVRRALADADAESVRADHLVERGRRRLP